MHACKAHGYPARRANQPILREISPEYLLEGLMLKLELQYFGHLMGRANSLEQTLMLGKIRAGREGDDRGWDGWTASPTQWTWVWASSGRWWRTGRPGVLQSMGSQRIGHDLAPEQQAFIYSQSCATVHKMNFRTRHHPAPIISYSSPPAHPGHPPCTPSLPFLSARLLWADERRRSGLSSGCSSGLLGTPAPHTCWAPGEGVWGLLCYRGYENSLCFGVTPSVVTEFLGTRPRKPVSLVFSRPRHTTHHEHWLINHKIIIRKSWKKEEANSQMTKTILSLFSC